MDKRYQVFLSSTYADLKEERRKVMQALMEMDCIPAGMELFPAADEEQFNFIKKVIDDCDYYLIIIGGRYGSTTVDGVSYTEKEYEYAVSRGIKVIAFLHEKPDDIPLGKSEKDPVLRERLADFRNKISSGRLVKFWTTAEQLPGLVSLSLQKTIKIYPAIGWVRANSVATESHLVELNDLRKVNDDLKNEVQRLSSHVTPVTKNIAGLDERFVVRCSHKPKGKFRSDADVSLTWRKIFSDVAPYLLEPLVESSFKMRVKDSVFSAFEDVRMNDQDYQTIKIQLIALRLISVDYLATVAGGRAMFVQLTQLGQKTVFEERSIKSGQIKGE
ncbi:MAG: DUF4062 domain-containing protein [Humidesulfovibrio sp.]